MKRRAPERAVVRIAVHADGYRVNLRKSRAQPHDTIIGDGSSTTFDAAFGNALIVARVLAAELVITAEAIAKFSQASDAFGQVVAEATIVEIYPSSDEPEVKP